MNKSGLVAELATRRSLTIRKADKAISTVFAAMSEALRTGERIEVRGFGSFAIREYQPYSGRNPKTGAVVGVKPKKLPFFKVVKEIRERLVSGP
jgi:integration host factor subunit beta